MRNRFAILLPALALVLAPRLPAQTEAEARAGYDASVRRFVELFKRNDIPALLRLYTRDATFVDADGTVMSGRAGVEKSLPSMLAGMSFKDYAIETSTFHSHGPLAYAAGVERFVLTDRKTGKEMRDSVRFLAVFRQQPDKQWLLQYGMEAPLKKAP